VQDALPEDRLTRWEKAGLWAFLGVVLLFGAITELRAAFLQTRKGDQEVYFWTAYAVLAGDNIYAVSDSHDWHYVYPPLFAILAVPFAEKPPDHPVEIWTLPFAVSVGIWYLLSFLLLIWAVHMLASAIEETTPELAARPWGRRWWALRFLPVLICLPGIGHTLARGQVNLLVLLLLAGMAAATLRGRPWRAGLWLSLAICIKLIPAFLLVFPLWRRDYRCLAGCTIGLTIGLVAVPVAVFGPERALAYNRDFAEKVILPGLGEGDDQSRADELFKMNATPSQSFITVMHNTMYPPWHLPRVIEVHPAIRAAHWLLGLLLTGAILWAAGWRQRASGPATILQLGCLMLVMILTSPVCHGHYFSLTVPLVMGLLAVSWQGKETRRLGIGWLALFGLFWLSHMLMVLPNMETPRDLGLGLYPALALLLAAIVVLYLQRRQAKPTSSRLPQRELAAEVQAA
jgi:alpha-1,2-mannosyltransferase